MLIAHGTPVLFASSSASLNLSVRPALLTDRKTRHQRRSTDGRGTTKPEGRQTSSCEGSSVVTRTTNTRGHSDNTTPTPTILFETNEKKRGPGKQRDTYPLLSPTRSQPLNPQTLAERKNHRKKTQPLTGEPCSTPPAGTRAWRGGTPSGGRLPRRTRRGWSCP